MESLFDRTAIGYATRHLRYSYKIPWFSISGFVRNYLNLVISCSQLFRF